jgi:hypothetical protein
LCNLFPRRGKKDPTGVQSHTKAIHVLGLEKSNMDKKKEIKVVNVKKFKEEEIILAFQNKYADIGK